VSAVRVAYASGSNDGDDRVASVAGQPDTKPVVIRGRAHGLPRLCTRKRSAFSTGAVRPSARTAADHDEVGQRPWTEDVFGVVNVGTCLLYAPLSTSDYGPRCFFN